MAKSPKKSTRPSSKIPTSKKAPQDGFMQQLETPRASWIGLGILFAIVLFLYSPMAFQGMDVQGSDVVSGIGNTKQIKTYEAETGIKPLWNPYMFAGMPIYHRYTAITWSADTLLFALTDLLDVRILFLLLGALGMFLLIRYLQQSTITALIAAAAFTLMPHFQALIVVGHFSKLRAIMWLPYVMLTFLILLEKRNLLSGLLFTTAFALMLRTQHYQIVFYGMLLLIFIGITPYVKLALEKKWGDFLRLNGLVVAAVVLVAMIVAQPLLPTRDFTPHSTRGGNAVNIQGPVSEQDKKGVGYDYATNWSYSAEEFWNLIVPRFHGGTSTEVYTGNAVSRFKNREIPAYWGDLPLTQSLEYLSVILAFLALIAIFFQWHNPLVKALTALTIFAILLSLGRNFSSLYKIFFYYLPFFDKFRVPMMILTLVSFNTCILAAIGIQEMFTRGFADKKRQKRLYILGAVYLVILSLPLLLGSSLALSPAGEVQRYTGQYGPDQARQLVELLKTARLDILQTSAIRTLFFFLMVGGLIFMLLKDIGKKSYLLVGLLVLVTLDLGLVSAGYLKGQFVDLDRIEQQVYRENAVDQIIRNDAKEQGESLYRVVPPIRSVASDSRWQYHHQSIGGYSPAKTQVIQDIITNNLITRTNPSMPINLNVLGLLNAKYLALSQRFPSLPELTYLGSDDNANIHAYRNEKALPRAFMVGETRVIEDGVERLKFMNTAEFDPSQTALLEAPLAAEIAAPDSNSYARVTDFKPNEMTLEVSTNTQTLLVLSEVYYPEWTATTDDGQTLEIYKTNHIIRSMVVPAGKHTIHLNFYPVNYFTGVTISWIGWLIVYGGLLFFGFMAYRKKTVISEQ